MAGPGDGGCVAYDTAGDAAGGDAGHAALGCMDYVFSKKNNRYKGSQFVVASLVAGGVAPGGVAGGLVASLAGLLLY